MSFYITLSSNNKLAENTIAEFITVLDEPITLEDDYEAALVEIIYPNRFRVNIGSLTLRNINSEDLEIRHELTFPDRCTAYDLASLIDFKFMTDNHERKLKTSFNPTSSEIHIKPAKGFEGKFNILLDEKAAKFFLSKNRNEMDLTNFKSRITPQIEVVEIFNIFCDLIEDQQVDGHKIQLLQFIQPEGQVYKRQNITFPEPHYCKVNKTYIPTIKVSIQDENGINIDFYNGPVILKLHFRKVKKNELLRNSSKRRVNGNVPRKHAIKLYNSFKSSNRARKRV